MKTLCNSSDVLPMSTRVRTESSALSTPCSGSPFSWIPSVKSELNSCLGPGWIMRSGDHGPQGGVCSPPRQRMCRRTPRSDSRTLETVRFCSAPPTTTSIAIVCTFPLVSLCSHDPMSPARDCPDQEITTKSFVGTGAPPYHTGKRTSGSVSSMLVLSMRSSIGSAPVATWTSGVGWL